MGNLGGHPLKGEKKRGLSIDNDSRFDICIKELNPSLKIRTKIEMVENAEEKTPINAIKSLLLT